MKTVLIVEDNDLNMKLFTELLEAGGYAYLTAKNGLDAIEAAGQFLPDLILMDIQLPGMSGIEAIRQIRSDERLSHTPIIAITAFAMKGDEEKIRLSGCQGYISKPISVAKFLVTINTLLS